MKNLIWILLVTACGTDMSGLAMVDDAGEPSESDAMPIRGRMLVPDAAGTGGGGGTAAGGIFGEGGAIQGGAGGILGVGGSGGAASGGAPMCVAEVCNGKDDDCDGSTDDETTCPDFVRWRGHNYIFGQEPTTRVTAEKWCRAFGYDLVVIDDANEATWIDGQAASRSASGRWLGVSDASSEGAWLRPDGMPATFFAWAAGQPNNNAPGVGEDCAALIPTSPGNPIPAWNDMRCASDGDPSGYALALCELAR